MSAIRASRETTDVIVVGSGAGGSVVAKELSEAGISVVVIEAGRRFQPTVDYRSDRPDFPVSSYGLFEPRDPRRDLYTTPTNATFTYARVKGVGGSTLVSWGVSPRFHESDFSVRTIDGLASDWPLTYQHLEPYYTQVEQELGMSGESGLGANPFGPPRSRPFPTPAHAMNRAGRIVARGAEKLGLHMFVPPLAMPTQPWQGRPACSGAGTCGWGCRSSAKSSADITYLRKAEVTGRVDVRSSAMARAITTNAEGLARSVIYVDAAGSEHEIVAKAIVVAGNAIETPRLLLMSATARDQAGLANSSGLVGKYLTEHLDIGCTARFAEPLENWRGAPVTAMLQDYYGTNPSRSFARGWILEVATTGNWPLEVAKRAKGWGGIHKQRMKELFGHELEVIATGEQLPDIRNQVTLDHQVKDHIGLPVPCIESQARGNDILMLRAMTESLRELVQASGPVEILEERPYRPGGSIHYMGTCRMGTDPKTSVTDQYGRTHDVENLFVADSSVFVTGAAVHPTLTLMALANRTADFMIEQFKRGDL